MSRRLPLGLNREEGGVLVMVAVWLPILIVFLSFAIDVSNWLEHRRHIQLQADAAALAGALEYRFPCNGTAVASRVTQYAGLPSSAGTTYNAQIGGTPSSRVHLVLNQPAFSNGRVPADDPTPGPLTGNPCADGSIDVKLTETDLPWYFKLNSLPLVGSAFGTPKAPSISGHARVSFFQEASRHDALPLGVPDTNPKSARAFLVDESGTLNQTGAPADPSTPMLKVCGPSGTDWCSVTLIKGGTGCGGTTRWCNAAGLRLALPTGAAKVGVRVAVGMFSSTACGQQWVSCYDASTGKGAVFIRGWSTSPAATPTTSPQWRSVELFNGTCSDPYFTSGAACTVGVKAVLDVGGAPTNTAAAQASIDGGGTWSNLIYDAAQGAWVANGTAAAPYLAVPAGGGARTVSVRWARYQPAAGGADVVVNGGTCIKNPNPVSKIWDTGNGKNNASCIGAGADVQRVMSPTTAATGLLLALTVSNAGSLWSNSLQQGTVASSLQFNARLQGNLQNAASVSDPVVLIRVAGSQNQSIDCDPALSNLRDEITGGCSPKYTRNTTGTCPSYSALWSTAQPWSCVKVQTGGAVGQVSQGMTDRILQGGSCAQHPNNWSLFPNFPTGDTRIVPVFVTPSGSFQGSGNDIFPVTDFAMFYVTGWGGNGNSAQCAGDDPVPDKGYIAGHFIKYLDTLGDGDTTQVCDPSGLTPCVPIMTR